jgi:transposase
MAQNFIESGREQGFLLPPDVRDWLPADHLAWFVIDAVAQMDLSGFYAAYRADGHGRAAYEPSMAVALVLHAFATRVRSSRTIEGHCRQDVPYRVITGSDAQLSMDARPSFALDRDVQIDARASFFAATSRILSPGRKSSGRG